MLPGNYRFSIITRRLITRHEAQHLHPSDTDGLDDIEKCIYHPTTKKDPIFLIRAPSPCPNENFAIINTGKPQLVLGKTLIQQKSPHQVNDAH